jgi:hypothetical protein
VGVRALEPEVALADRVVLAVELDRIDALAREVVAVRAGDRAGGVAENRDPPWHAAVARERQYEEVVPVTPAQVAPGAVQRVDRDALVEL